VRKIDRYRITRVSEKELIAQQVNLFGEAGINWVRAHQVVTGLIGEHTDFKSMRSQHYELFAELSRVSPPKRILEIGTSDASFTAFMARVCPDAIVETIDLAAPNTDITGREINLGISPNIVFREMNSLELCRFDGPKYDLIWVDGDHTFPVVACDIANAVRLLEPKGVMMCDDIYLSRLVEGRGYEESLEVLDAFTEASMIWSRFVLKSIRPEKNYSRRQKHLAIVKLVT
jgi:predicted O-methyltransferase YrrM